jgi:RNA polymerase sigma-70 factor (ECF subfamily)
VEFHQNYVYVVAFRFLCNDYEAEEVIQETFIRVWKNLSRFNQDMRFTTWLYKIVTNLCCDRLRSRKRTPHILPFDMENAALLNQPSTENIESALINRELADLIRFLTENLTPMQRIVFTLSELEELTVDEVVTITGLTPQKIKSNLYCARQAIRNKLTRMEERRGKDE